MYVCVCACGCFCCCCCLYSPSPPLPHVSPSLRRTPDGSLHARVLFVFAVCFFRWQHATRLSFSLLFSVPPPRNGRALTFAYAAACTPQTPGELERMCGWVSTWGSLAPPRATNVRRRKRGQVLVRYPLNRRRRHPCSSPPQGPHHYLIDLVSENRERHTRTRTHRRRRWHEYSPNMSVSSPRATPATFADALLRAFVVACPTPGWSAPHHHPTQEKKNLWCASHVTESVGTHITS